MRALKPLGTRGVTLVELMITVVILSVAALGLVGTFTYITRAAEMHRTTTLATNASQEYIEIYKNNSYFQIIPTSLPSYNTNFSPAIPYDSVNFPPSTLQIGNKTFTRLTYVERVLSDNGNLVQVPPDSMDTGLKRITITTVWQIGTTWHRNTLINLMASAQYSDTSGFVGTVTDFTTGQPIGGSDVYCKGDAIFHDFSDNSGNYVMSATPGNFSVTAQAPGYFPQTLGPFSIVNGTLQTANFTLHEMGITKVSGAVYVNNNLLISQVVSSTVQAHLGPYSNIDVQYVELFNPTTSSLFVGSASSHTVKFNFTSLVGYTCSDIAMTYSTQTIQSYGYYLIADTPSFMVNGQMVFADAYFKNAINDGTANSGSLPSAGPDCSGSGSGQCLDGQFRAPCAGHSGGVWLTDYLNRTMDGVGWSNGVSDPSPCSGNCFYYSAGMPRGDELVRMASTGTVNYSLGPAYDTNQSSFNFVDTSAAIWTPRSGRFMSSTATVVSGTPAVGAVITCNDGLSASATAYAITSNGFSYATFTLVNIATGTWNIEISTGFSYLMISSVAVLTPNMSTTVPNVMTVPQWPMTGFYNALLTNTTSNGLINGQVTDPNGIPLSAIQVTVHGGNTVNTSAAGYYNISAPANTYSVIANQNSVNSTYTSAQIDQVVVLPGQQTNGINFVLSGAGRVNGLVVNTSLSNAYPGVVVNAVDGNGNAVGQVVTGANGKFIMNNLSTGTYTFELALDPDQSNTALALGTCNSAQGAILCAVTAGANVSIGTFTVQGAYGQISGKATCSTASCGIIGAPITTGVLIVATTGTINGLYPPLISTAVLMTTPYYMASSLSDGTYNFNVRASTASDTFNLYGWYTTFTSTGAPSFQKVHTTVNVVGGQTATANLQW